ncbi:MAG: site-2 protease family protein, partial [Planctomycetota bacterium]
MLDILATAIGIGLLLFFHESGHFLAARLAGVRVEVFSMGFGPRLFGWEHKGCDYRFSLLPLGGYVKLAGEEQTRSPVAGELGAASPGWRFFIFSGGILMNFLVAVILFPLLFRVGVPFEASVAGKVEPGGPAWEAGLQEGDRILSVDGQPMFAFRHLASAVALSEADRPLDLELEAEGGNRRSLVVQPRYDEAAGFRRLGVGLPLDPELHLGVSKGSPAWEAGIRPGDRLVAVEGWRIP